MYHLSFTVSPSGLVLSNDPSPRPIPSLLYPLRQDSPSVKCSQVSFSYRNGDVPVTEEDC